VILITGQMIKAFAGLIAVVLMMTGEHKVYMKITIIWGIINVILSVLLVSRFGMIGAAAATAFCLSMVDMYSIHIIHKKLSVLTLAKGYKFDIVFIAAVSIIYSLFGYNEMNNGYHLLLIVSLIIYMWKSIRYNDIPWRLLLSNHKTG